MVDTADIKPIPEGSKDYSSVLTAKMAEDDVKEVHKVMIHFDCLFDLRAAALQVINEEFLSMIRIDGSYYKRQYDVFGDDELGYISKNQLDRIINECCGAVAEKAKMTRIIELILDYVTEYLDKSKMSPHAQTVDLLLNFGHYPFSDEQKLYVFDYFNSIFEPMDVQVTACDYTVAELHEGNLNDVDSLFIYDWLTWLNCHETRIGHHKFKVKLHCPKVVPIPNGEVDKLPQIKQTLKDLRMTPFDFIKKGISRYLGFSFLDVIYFSLLDELSNPVVEKSKLKT